MKLWGGRFEKSTDGMVDDFHSSITFDKRLYKQDIEGSIAHATMLGEQGILTPADADAIVAGLKDLLQDIEAGKVDFQLDAEDIHMNVETLLTARIGQAGKRLHTGRSRNDQVALDCRMYVKDVADEAVAHLAELLHALLDAAELHKADIMPGYTHMQKAQPITLGHHLCAYAEMFRRDIGRFQAAKAAADAMPLGSGALAGTTYPLNRARVAELLGFSQLTRNSLDGVSDRDFVLDYLYACSVTMMHLSRFCEELILLEHERVPVRRDGRRLRHRFLHHAAEEEPGHGRAHPRQDRPRLRRPDGAADRDEGPAPGLQQGHAGGQGGAL